MNKKTTKLMATALTATMGAGIATQLVQAAEVTPVQAATQAVEAMEKNPTGENIDKAYNAVVALEAGAEKDALYKRVEAVAAPHHKKVYDIMVTAREKKDLKTIGEARTAVAGMAKIFINDAYTWSSELDTFTIEYQKTVVDTLNAIVDGKEEVKQATINELREIIVGLELQRSNEGLLKLVLDYSATLDKVQMDYVNEVLTEVNAATTEAKLEAAKVKYNDLLTMKDEALKTEVQSNIGAVIVAKEAELSTPKVESVSAIDAKTVEIKFSHAVDAKTLKDASSVDVIKVTAKTGAVDPSTITQTLSDDGKTLTLTAANYFKGDYIVSVPFEIVKSTNGKYVAPVNKSLTVNDTAAPVLSAASATVKSTKDNVKLITLTFNENVEMIDNVKINGINYVPSVVGKTATVAVDLDSTKTYEVTVVNAVDAAGNLKDVQTTTLNVTVDSTAPSITNVVATGENTLKVTVDKALDSDSLVITGKVGTFTADVVASAVVNPDNKKEYVVTLKDAYLYKNGNSDTVTLTVAKDSLKDTLGNVNAADIVKTVVVTKDAVAPTITKVENTVTAGKVTGFTVTYSEEVMSLDTSKVSIVNSKGEILSYATVVSSAIISPTDAKKVVFSFDNSVAADKYGFDFAEGLVTDKSLAKNKTAKNAFVVDVTDVTAPVETTFTIADAEVVASNVVNVKFGSKVKATGTGSALNPASYQINGTVLPSDTVIKFVTNAGVVDQTQVNITLPLGFIKTSDAKAIFRVTGVQTLDNKVNNSFIKEIAVTDNTAPEAKSFVATELDKITVTYSEALQVLGGTADVTDEIQLFDSKGDTIAITASSVTADGKLVLTVADSTQVSKLTTVTASTVDIMDASGIAQKVGVTVLK